MNPEVTAFAALGQIAREGDGKTPGRGGERGERS
jgi:hypothetical protein